LSGKVSFDLVQLAEDGGLNLVQLATAAVAHPCRLHGHVADAGDAESKASRVALLLQEPGEGETKGADLRRQPVVVGRVMEGAAQAAAEDTVVGAGLELGLERGQAILCLGSGLSGSDL